MLDLKKSNFKISKSKSKSRGEYFVIRLGRKVVGRVYSEEEIDYVIDNYIYNVENQPDLKREIIDDLELDL